MNNTKNRIIKSAIELFNKEGTMNIVLQKIADKSKISIGNLTYHFKNRELLIIAIFDYVQEELYHIFDGISLVPTVKDILKVEINLLKFQDNHKFIFLNFVDIVNNNEEISNKFRENISFQIQMIITLLRQGVESGNYKKEYEDQFENLAKIIWNIYFNRLNRELVMNETYGLLEFAKDIWLILKPFLTEEGIKRYENIFQNDIINNYSTK